jgi:hypothetical protein
MFEPVILLYGWPHEGCLQSLDVLSTFLHVLPGACQAELLGGIAHRFL